MTPPTSRARSQPTRILTVVPLCDGHDSAINTINLELVRGGVEVVYLGYHRSAETIVRAAIQEDVRAIGISSYNGGHVEFFGEVMSLLKRRAGHGHLCVRIPNHQIGIVARSNRALAIAESAQPSGLMAHPARDVTDRESAARCAHPHCGQ